MHLTYYIELNSLLHELHFDMIFLMEMTQWTQYWIRQKQLSSVCFRLLPTDVVWENIFLFCLCRVIALAYCFGKMALFTAIMDAILL